MLGDLACFAIAAGFFSACAVSQNWSALYESGLFMIQEIQHGLDSIFQQVMFQHMLPGLFRGLA